MAVVALVATMVWGGPAGAAASDPLRPHQWGLDQIRADQAWSASRGHGTTIAIIDSGIDYTHPDLAGKFVPGVTFLDCGTAGCGDGGWTNGSYHGTHVAGIAAASAENGEGIAGVAPDASLMSVRVLDRDGRGNLRDVALAMRWAVDHGADVLNLSLGSAAGTQIVSEGLGEVEIARAAQYAVARGAVVVAAAGNSTFPLCNPPAYTADIVCVAATDKRESTAAYSNFPNKRRPLGVAAPGGSLLEIGRVFADPLCFEGVLSTMPEGTGFNLCGQSPQGLYDELSGTSMASPHVAGVAALLRSLGCSTQQTASLLTSTARHPVTGARGEWSPTYGYGIVDAGLAVERAKTACDGGPPPDPRPAPPQECLESRQEDFAVSVLENPPPPAGWHVETPTNDDGTGTWATDFDHVAFDSTVRSMATGRGAKDDRLVAPEFAATELTTVEFSHEYLLEPGRDGGVVETSIDGGRTWDAVPAEHLYGHGYDTTIDPRAASPIAGRPAFSGRNPHHVWRRILADVEVDLSHLAGEQVLLRWRLVQDSARSEALPGVKWALHWVRFSGTLTAGCGDWYDR